MSTTDTNQAAVWNDAMLQSQMADDRYKAGKVAGKPDRELDQLCTDASDAESALLEAPAPDLPALRWKLDKLFEPCGDSTTAWSMEYVAQTIADYRRLLGGE